MRTLIWTISGFIGGGIVNYLVWDLQTAVSTFTPLLLGSVVLYFNQRLGGNNPT